MNTKATPCLIKSVTGVVLAGGKSTRMGSDKAVSRLGRQTLVERCLATLRDCFARNILITNNPVAFAHLQLPTFPDVITDLGPLGGIYAALHYSTTPAIFVVACDMPFLDADLIRAMTRRLRGVDAVVPRRSGRFEPLHAVYHRRLLRAVKHQVSTGDYSMQRFLKTVRVKPLSEIDLREYPGWETIFFNVNTPAELRKAQELRNRKIERRGQRMNTAQHSRN